MALSINTNAAALNAQRNQGRAQNDLSSSLARLSSGLRINSARDDAAGLAIADRFSAQIRGATQAGRNANDGISLAQTAEGGLTSIDSNLQRIRELAVQSANATNSASDRAALQLEVTQLQGEIDRVATQTAFNGNTLLDGSFAAKAFQVGGNVGQTITLPSIASARSSALGVAQGFGQSFLSVGTASNTPTALTFAVGGAAPISLGNVAIDAKAIAAAINGSGIAGLSASIEVSSLAAASTANASAPGTATYTVNGVAINIAGSNGTGSLSANRAAAVAAINAQSAATGVFALAGGNSVAVYASDGRNVSLSYTAGSFSGSTAADFGLATTALNAASIDINYVAPVGTTGNVVFAQAGGFNLTSAIGSIGSPLASVDISNVAGANAALTTIDTALASVASARASLGAAQNRFTSTIENLQTAGENLAASRGRIQDADFAAETANLSRAQVLQQAGTAMIAQANQMPSQVLSLLR